MSGVLLTFNFPHKTASMFAWRLAKAISAENEDWNLYSPNASPPNHAEALADLQSGRTSKALFAPARRYEGPGSTLVHVTLYRVLQLRDPLDMLVSQYFSHGWSHPSSRWSERALEMRLAISEGKLSVREYCELEIEHGSGFTGSSLVDRIGSISRQSDPSRDLLLRYEQMVLDYTTWSARLGNFLTGVGLSCDSLLDCQPETLELDPRLKGRFFADPMEYVSEFGIRSGRHIRVGIPGDHRRFLNDYEVDELWDLLSERMPDSALLRWSNDGKT